MSNQTSEGTGAPFPVKIRGVEYLAKPMTYNAIGEFEAAAVKWYLDRAEQATERLPDDQKNAEMIAASRVARNMFYGFRPGAGASPDAIAAADLMRNFDRSDAGIVRLAYLMLRPRHPELTIETIGEWCSDPALKFDLLAQLWRTRISEDDESPETDAPKNG